VGEERLSDKSVLEVTDIVVFVRGVKACELVIIVWLNAFTVGTEEVAKGRLRVGVEALLLMEEFVLEDGKTQQAHCFW
jgi:hypothetical protein